jgi:hypothetical protein
MGERIGTQELWAEARDLAVHFMPPNFPAPTQPSEPFGLKWSALPHTQAAEISNWSSFPQSTRLILTTPSTAGSNAGAFSLKVVRTTANGWSFTADKSGGCSPGVTVGEMDVVVIDTSSGRAATFPYHISVDCDIGTASVPTNP